MNNRWSVDIDKMTATNSRAARVWELKEEGGVLYGFEDGEWIEAKDIVQEKYRDAKNLAAEQILLGESDE